MVTKLNQSIAYFIYVSKVKTNNNHVSGYCAFFFFFLQATYFIITKMILD